MNPLDLIQSQYDNFTKTEKNIAVHILNNPRDFARSSIDYNVTALAVSKAALIRFSKKIGYTGYVEFKFDLSRFLTSNNFGSNDTQEKNSSIDIVSQGYCSYLEQMSSYIDQTTLKNIVKRIKSANKLKIFALDRTSLSALQLQMRCLKIGFDIATISTRVAMSDLAALMDKDDLCIIFTVKDNGKTYAPIVDILASTSCEIAVVTMTPQLSFLKKCDHVITLPPVSSSYGNFIDEQLLFFAFVEVLIYELSR